MTKPTIPESRQITDERLDEETERVIGPIWVCGRLKLKHVIAGALSPRIPKGGPK